MDTDLWQWHGWRKKENFKKKRKVAPRNRAPTAASVAGIQRYWAENINSGENMEHTQSKLEDLSNIETKIAEHEMARCGVEHDDAAPLTDKEEKLGCIEARIQENGIADEERVKLNRARWR